MDGYAERDRAEKAVQPCEVAAVTQEPRDKIEPENILHRRAVAVQLNGRIAPDDAHQRETDAEKREDRQVEGICTRPDRLLPTHPSPDDPEEREKDQQLVPDGGEQRHGQKLPQRIVDQNVNAEQRQKQSRHAAPEQPAEQTAFPAAAGDRGKAAVQA